MNNSKLHRKIEALQDLMVKSIDDDYIHPKDEMAYSALRAELMADSAIEEALPHIATRCADLTKLWQYFKRDVDIGHDQGKREYIWREFRPLLESLKSTDPAKSQAFFPKGASHDAYAHIRSILQTAKSSLLIIDGYMDSTIYTVLSTMTGPLDINILTSKVPADFALEGKKFNVQHGSFRVELRKTKDFHDRFIVVDSRACYFLGASIKDAGDKSFSIVPLKDPAVVKFFLNYANQVWNAANPITP